MALSHLAARVFGTALLIAPEKLEAILAVVGPRLGLDAMPMPTGPVAEPKKRSALDVDADSIATIQVMGSLAHRCSAMEADSGMQSYQTVAAELDRALADPNVEGILLEVDSFGGEAAGCFDLADRIMAARSQKPIVGVASQYAMSAGYALLSQASEVFVPQVGEVGSIGVVTTHVDMTAADAAMGLRVTHVHAGARKVDMSPHRALSDEARSRLEAEVGTVYDRFVAVVGRGRGSKLSEVSARATEAATYLGQKAVDAGLADAVGDVSAARARLVDMIREGRMKELEAARAEINALQAKLAESTKALEVSGAAQKALEATIATYKADAAHAKKLELDRVVSEMVGECVAAGATPPEKAEREELRAALDVNEALGRKLVTATRERCLATAKRSTGSTVNLSPPDEKKAERAKFLAGIGGAKPAQKE